MSQTYRFDTPDVLDVASFTRYLQDHFPSCLNNLFFEDSSAPYINMTFSSVLSAEAQNLILQTIQSYANDPAPAQPPIFYLKCSGMQSMTTTSTDWVTLMFSTYQGYLEHSLGLLTEVKTGSFVTPNSPDDSSYAEFWHEVRIIDGSGNVITSGRFTNNALQINTMQVLNAPVNPDYFQIQVRKGEAGISVTVAGLCYKHELIES